MNTILEQINSAGFVFVKFAVPMLVQSAVLIVVLLLTDLLLRKKVRAVVRYWLWMLVLLKLVLPTTLSSPVSLGSWFGDKLASIKVSDTNIVAQPINLPQITVAETTAVAGMPSTDVRPIVTPPQSVEPVAAASLLVSPATLTWQGIVFLVWAAVVAAMGLLLLQRAIFVSGLVVQAQNPTQLMNDAFRFCCGQMGIKSKVDLKVSANTVSPAVCGLFRPVILVPQNLAPTLGSSRLRPVLLHELAHISRGDLWMNLAQTILQIIYFYNPLLWLANSIIRRIREQAVDEAVQVTMGTNAPQYPQTLVEVAKMAFNRPVLSLRLIGVVESKSALKGRIKRMLDRPVPKSAKLGILGIAILVIVGFTLLPMAKAAKPEKVDQNPIGKWQSVDFVKNIKDFKPWGKNWQGDLYLKDVEFMRNGKTSSFFTWRKNLIRHNNGRTEAAYQIKEMNGSRYLFLPWLSGDVTMRGRKPNYYVMKEVQDDKNDNSVFKAELDKGVTVKEGIGFDDIIVGDPNCTGEFIKSKFGKPDMENQDEEQGWWIVYQKNYGLNFWLNMQENILFEIRLNRGFKGKLSSGISMSSTKQDVFDTYGQPIREEVTENFDGRSDDRVLLFRKPSWSNWVKFRGTPPQKINYNDKGLLFGFEGNTISQIVVFKRFDPSRDKFKAMLSNGVVVELAGVCERPSQGKQWWSPSGAMLQNKPYDKPTSLRVSPARNKQAREIAVLLQGNLEEGVGFRYKIPIAENSSSDSVVDTHKDGEQLKAIYGVAFDAPVESEAADISLGIGAGPWHTIASSTADFKETRGSGGNAGGVVWHEPVVENGKTIISVAHSYINENVRIAAVTKDNAVHTSGSTSSSVADFESIRATFDVSLSEIKEFCFQTRPYQWIKFKNVSLRPGIKTDVQVEIEETGLFTGKDKIAPENSQQVETNEEKNEGRKQQPPDINAKKKEIATKLEALYDQRDNLQTEVDVAEKAMGEVRDRFNIYDLEENPHPIVERLNRLQKEQDDCALEISQVKARVENLKAGKHTEQEQKYLKDTKNLLAELQAKFDALEKMRTEAEARKKDLDLARIQYNQREAVKVERLQQLNELKSQIEKLKLMYENPDAFGARVETEKKVYSVKFRPKGDFNPTTAKELLDAFNNVVRFRVNTHHFRTAIENDKLAGFILTDGPAEQKAIKLMLDDSDKLEFVNSKAITEDKLAEHYTMGQPSLDGGAQTETESKKQD